MRIDHLPPSCNVLILADTIPLQRLGRIPGSASLVPPRVRPDVAVTSVLGLSCSGRSARMKMPEDWDQQLAVLRESLVVLPQLVKGLHPIDFAPLRLKSRAIRAPSVSQHSIPTRRRHSACGALCERTTSASALQCRPTTASAVASLRGATRASASVITLQAGTS